MTFGSLFAGIGGLDLGFECVGLECKWQVEIDDYASRVLEKHWPHVHREKDINHCGRINLEPVDIIAGGFPCQDISYAGKGEGLEGERSGLFYEAIRIICELEPRYVVLENVAALLTRGLGDVLGTLASIGYDAEWHCIPAASVGAPHIRDRIFILAHSTQHRRKQRQPNIGWLSQRISERKEQGSANGGDVDVAYANGKGLERQREFACGTSTQQQDIGSARWWEIEPEVGRVADGVPGRVDRLRGLGNAVVPQVAAVVGQMVIDLDKAANGEA